MKQKIIDILNYLDSKNIKHNKDDFVIDKLLKDLYHIKYYLDYYSKCDITTQRIALCNIVFIISNKLKIINSMQNFRHIILNVYSPETHNNFREFEDSKHYNSTKTYPFISTYQWGINANGLRERRLYIDRVIKEIEKLNKL